MLLESWQTTKSLGSPDLYFSVFVNVRKLKNDNSQQPPENLNIILPRTLPNQWPLVFDVGQTSINYPSSAHIPTARGPLLLAPTHALSVLNSLPVAVNPKKHTQRFKKD